MAEMEVEAEVRAGCGAGVGAGGQAGGRGARRRRSLAGVRNVCGVEWAAEVGNLFQGPGQPRVLKTGIFVRDLNIWTPLNKSDTQRNYSSGLKL